MRSVADVAEEWLAPGPMAYTLRTADYVRFLDAFAGKGKAIKGTATSCAMFVGACLIHAGVQAPRTPPKARGITTWLGVHGFSGSWIPRALLEGDGVRRDDIWYICSERGSIPLGDGRVYTWTTWPAAANGHVGIARADGWIVPTAEGGGSPGGTGCRLSDGPKDLRKMGRAFRGVWRPSLMNARTETNPDPSPQPPHPSLTLGEPTGRRVLRLTRPRMTGEDVRLFQGMAGNVATDGVYGPQSEARAREIQQKHGLLADGVVGLETWAKLEGK